MKYLLIIISLLLGSCSCEDKQEVVKKDVLKNAPIKDRACTYILTDDHGNVWGCGKESIGRYVYCEYKSVKNQRVSCVCFARIKTKCDSELYISLPEFEEKLKELGGNQKVEGEYQ